jgi:hypothetical protein
LVDSPGRRSRLSDLAKHVRASGINPCAREAALCQVRGAGNLAAPPSSLFSTGCTEGCGNVDYSRSANCGLFCFRAPCAMAREAIDSLLRRARRGSRTKQHREAVRGGSQGPKRKVDRGCGRNRDRLGEFFLVPPSSPVAYRFVRVDESTTIAKMHFRPPSIDQGVIALMWAIGLAAYIYFGLVAVGASDATSIVIALVSFAAIWLFVRLRGEETPVRRRSPRRHG